MTSYNPVCLAWCHVPVQYSMLPMYRDIWPGQHALWAQWGRVTVRYCGVRPIWHRQGSNILGKLKASNFSGSGSVWFYQ